MQKTSFFPAALFDRSFRASPSSLKRDVNNSIQSSNSLSANGTVAHSSGSEDLWRMMSEDWFLFFFFTYLLVFINKDRNTVSSLPLQPVFIEEVAYVTKKLHMLLFISHCHSTYKLSLKGSKSAHFSPSIRGFPMLKHLSRRV